MGTIAIRRGPVTEGYKVEPPGRVSSAGAQAAKKYLTGYVNYGMIIHNLTERKTLWII